MSCEDGAAKIGTKQDRHGVEPMMFRLASENANIIDSIGRDAIRDAHVAVVIALYPDPLSGNGTVRESLDGVRHLERKVDGEWVEVATFPPSPKWRKS